MGLNIHLECKVIEKFVDKNKHERYLGFALSSKNRWKFTNELPHFQDFKWSLFKRIDKDEKETILAAVKKGNFHDNRCYVISFDPEIDGKTLDTNDAINEVINGNIGTILVFGDANLIIYGGEEMKSRYISNLITLS